MNMVLLILLIASILVLLVFLFSLKVKLEFNSNKSDLNMMFSWLNPFIKAFISVKNSVPILKIFLFNKLIFNKSLKMQNHQTKGIDLIKISEPKDVHIDVDYGFTDPFVTGITYGAINIASHFIDVDSINQTPDFMSNNDYICLNATAKVNIGQALINHLKSNNN